MTQLYVHKKVYKPIHVGEEQMCYLPAKPFWNKEKWALCLKYRLISYAQDYEGTFPLCRAQEPTDNMYVYASWPCTAHFAQ